MGIFGEFASSDTNLSYLGCETDTVACGEQRNQREIGIKTRLLVASNETREKGDRDSDLALA